MFARPEIVIDAEEADRALAHYALGPTLGQAVSGGGTANANLVIDTTEGRFFLRRRNPKYSQREFVAFDHALMEHLAAAGLCTPLALPSREGRRWVELDGRVYELYPFMPGGEHDPTSEGEVRDSAATLARFHRATRDMIVPPGKDWPRYDAPQLIREGLAEARELDDGSHAEELGTAEAHLELLQRRLPDERYAALPQLVIHGDYHPANVKFQDGRVVGVFDVDWATRQPRVRDLADGLLFFAAERDAPMDAADIYSVTQPFRLTEQRARLFLEAYEGIDALTSEETAALPEFMRARWLHCRVQGMAKVPPEARVHFLLRDILEPLRTLGTVTCFPNSGNR